MCFSSSASRCEVCSRTWIHTHTHHRSRVGQQEALTTGGQGDGAQQGWLPWGRGWETFRGLLAMGQPRTGRNESLAAECRPELRHSWAQMCSRLHGGEELLDFLVRWAPEAPSARPGLTVSAEPWGHPAPLPRRRRCRVPGILHRPPTISGRSEVASGSQERKAGRTRSLHPSQHVWSTREKELRWPL